jgi:hypothetical protein
MEIPPPSASAVRHRAGHRPPAAIPLHHRPEKGQCFATSPNRRGRGAADSGAASFTGQ